MHKGAVLVWLGAALLLAGCNALEGRYLREGVGTELSSADLADTTNIQDLYVGEICRQAGLRVIKQQNGVYCDELRMRPNEWATFVQAGMNDIDRRCDAYLAWLDNKRRWRAPILAQLHTTAATTAAILGLTGVDAKSIAIVAAAFGFAQDTFVNFDARLITEVDHAVVQSVVLDNQSQYRIRIVNEAINNRPAAIYLLRNYLRICMPFSIEMSISNTVTTYHRSGAGALMREPGILSRPPGIARRTATAPAAPRETIGSRRSIGDTDPSYARIIDGYDPVVDTTGYVRGVLSKLCVRSRERLVTSRTNALIRAYQLYAYGSQPNGKSLVTGRLTADEMTRINGLPGACPDNRANFYEWKDPAFSNGVNAVPLVQLVNKKLLAGQKLPEDGSAEVDDVRRKIRIIKSNLGSKLSLKDSALANQFTPDLMDQLN
jgi:hypothetical protein